MRFSQVRLLTDDPEGTFRFLQRLGLEPTFGAEGDDYASFRAGDGTVALYRRSGQGDTVGLRLPGDSALLVLEVDDVDAEAARLGEWLVQEPVDRREWGGRVAYLREPGGNLVELFQTLPGALA
jgi:catechol 2,3-dioxygenase-like lactoylglutathione lyase family enzyme